MGLRLKGSMKLSHFTLEIDLGFKDINEVERFINWTERMQCFHQVRGG